MFKGDKNGQPLEKKLFRLLRAVGFIMFYLKEVISANLRIARDILSPHLDASPGVIAVPLDELSDLQMMALSNLITMTPGTLSLDISDDRRSLYVHAMYVDDPEMLRREIKDGYEKKIKEIF